jgi:hypothetical protein
MCPRLRLGNLSAGRAVDAPIVEALNIFGDGASRRANRIVGDDEC